MMIPVRPSKFRLGLIKGSIGDMHGGEEPGELVDGEDEEDEERGERTTNGANSADQERAEECVRTCK